MKKGKSVRTGKLQRYFCKNCKSYFQSKKRPDKLIQIIWNKYYDKRRTLKDLACEYGKSIKWIRQQINKAKTTIRRINPQGLVIVADATYFSRAYGFIVFRSPELKKNLYSACIAWESIIEYRKGIETIQRQGFSIKAVVLDGRPGVRNLFADVPVQMCHFHQKKIIQRYLTSNPKLEAGIELKQISDTLTTTNEKEFTNKLTSWYIKWNVFLKEKSIDIFNPKRWHYTHKRLRSAYRSLNINLPYFFTYQRYPKLNIPSTTNSLEGSFAHLKEKVTIHRGLKFNIKRKIIEQILVD